MIAIFCALAAQHQTATLFGDGHQTRNFVYVKDVVEAFVAAGRSDVEGTINVSTGTETSLLELAAALGLATVPGPSLLGEIQRLCLDPSAAEERLGWRARTPLGIGVEQTLAAQRAPLERVP
jgi:UDP-glucose 4-epimerase